MITYDRGTRTNLNIRRCPYHRRLEYRRSLRVSWFICGTYLLALGSSLTTSAALAHAQDTIKLGLLVPLSGPLEPLGRQVKAGAELALQDLSDSVNQDVELFLPDAYQVESSSWEEPDDIQIAYDLFKENDVDFIIGGVTTTASDALRRIATEEGIPVILLSPTSQSLPTHFLQMGVTQEEIFRETARQWATELNITDLMVIYDKSDDESYRYGVNITPQVFEGIADEIRRVPFPASRGPLYERQVEQALKYRPNGIIVAGLPWESANIVRQLGAEIEAPIYIATPTNWSHQVWRFASEDNVQVYYGTQFWPDNYQDSENFALRIREQIGWSKAEISVQSMQAYDAVRIWNEVWNSQPGEVPRPATTAIQSVGITGQLSFADDQIVRSPLRLLHVNEDNYPTSCPLCK